MWGRTRVRFYHYLLLNHRKILTISGIRVKQVGIFFSPNETSCAPGSGYSGPMPFSCRECLRSFPWLSLAFSRETNDQWNADQRYRSEPDTTGVV